MKALVVGLVLVEQEENLLLQLVEGGSLPHMLFMHGPYEVGVVVKLFKAYPPGNIYLRSCN